MLVDEYQDTNAVQYLWLRLLAQGRAQCLLRRRRRPVDLWLARRRGRQHPALRARFSRREGHPARAQLPLDRAYPRRRRRISSRTTRAGSARRCCTDGDAGREARPSPASGIPRRKPAPSARRSSSCSASGHRARRDRDPGARLVPDARIRRALHHARPALSRHRRPALLRARRNPRRARLSARASIRRPTISPSSASSMCRSAASATPRVQLLHDHARASAACR